MPRIFDDERYKLALERTQVMLDRELREFRGRLASRMVGLVSVALDEMNDVFDEAKLRAALRSYDTVFVEEALSYLRRVLMQAGEIELAKRLGEAHDRIGLEQLPEDFKRAYEEMQRAGLPITEGSPGPSSTRMGEVN